MTTLRPCKQVSVTDVATAPHLAHWPPGLPYRLEYPQLPVGAILAGAARRFGDRTALHHDDHELS